MSLDRARKRHSFELLDGVYKVRGRNREVLAICDDPVVAGRIAAAMNATPDAALADEVQEAQDAKAAREHLDILFEHDV